MENNKLLAVRVSEDVHTLAHMTARHERKTLSEWLREIIKSNLSEFFLPPAVQVKKLNVQHIQQQ